MLKALNCLHYKKKKIDKRPVISLERLSVAFNKFLLIDFRKKGEE